MYEIASHVERWLAEGRAVTVATLIGARGFSSRSRSPFAAWTAGQPAIGRLLTDDADEVLPAALLTLTGAASTDTGVVEVSVSDREAVGAGLSCGGVARLLVQDGASFPADVWSRLLGREPLCLLTTLDDRITTAYDGAGIDAARERFGPLVARLFARGTTAVSVLDAGAGVVVTVLWPVPNVVIVGDGLIADALAAQVSLLGWSNRLSADADEALAVILELSPADAVVVLSHDRAVDGPVLAAALDRDIGYVGALGSRSTQAARGVWLDARGVPADVVATIHGPAGIDLGAHSPAEIALSITAEILATRAGSVGGSLRDRSGPVHTDGVKAPPPRYPIR